MAVVEYAIRNGVATIALNRPQVLNASNLEMKRLLLQMLAQAETDESVRTLILIGNGRAFCTGGDMKESAGFSLEAYQFAIRQQHHVCAAIRNSDKPVIAAINGYALGGGLEMAMMCDIRIAATSARFGIPVLAAGSVATGALYHQLIQTIGLSRTVYMALTADPVDAVEAERIGLVSGVVEDAALPEAADTLGRKIGSHPLLGVALCKRALRQAAELTFDAALELDEKLALASRTKNAG